MERWSWCSKLQSLALKASLNMFERGDQVAK